MTRHTPPGKVRYFEPIARASLATPSSSAALTVGGRLAVADG